MRTPRGFTIYEHLTDTYGNEVTVQESSHADGDRVWIFASGGPGSPHLNVEQATRVRDALTDFISEHS